MYKNYTKRILDFTLSLLALILLVPFLIPIIICLKLTGENNVFYLQDRVGFKNKIFSIWKFATMLKDSPKLNTGSLTIVDDPRILPAGKILRKTKINELPQIFNVLKGDMSIVGPRPQMNVDFEKYSDEVQKVIYNVKPGVTGLASIVFRDEEKWISECDMDPHTFYTTHIAPYKGDLELWYQDNVSLINDIKIIFATAWVILFPRSNIIFKFLKELPVKPQHLK